MATIPLPHGNTEILAIIPDTQLGEVVTPRHLPGGQNLTDLLQGCLSHPTGSPPLETLAHAGQQVAVIVDDISRPTPTADLLPPVLARLHQAGVHAKDIVIVIALGSHRPMTSQELRQKLGRKISTTYTIVNTPCTASQEMQSLGMSQNGIPAEINKQVARADLRIGIGSIAPHMDTGFSGGGKLILPGVCSCRTVDAFHARSADTRGNQLGQPQAPTRLSMEAFVQEKIPMDFIINVILRPDNTVYQCVAGHFIAAHRQGVQHAQRLFGVPVQRKYPLVIVNAYPFDIDFWQSSKAFWSGERMVTPNGLVVMVSPCPEGTATHPLWAEYLEWSPRDLELQLKNGDAQDPNACAFAVMFNRMRENIRYGIIAPTIPHHQIRAMGMVPFDSIEQAVTSVPEAKTWGSVAIITHGGITIPMPAHSP